MGGDAQERSHGYGRGLSGVDRRPRRNYGKAPDLEDSIKRSRQTSPKAKTVTAKSYIQGQAAQSALRCFALTSNLKFMSEEGADVTDVR